MAYQYLLFDNDGTLMDFKKAQSAALEKAYAACDSSRRIPYSQKILDIYDRCNESWWAKLEKGLCTKAELQIGRFSDLFREIGCEEDPQLFNSHYMKYLGEGRFLIEGALELLKELSASYEIYIITNGVSQTQHNRIDHCAFAPYIRGIFVSEETGFVKPQKEYFDYVMNKIGCMDKNRYLIIGDSLSSDIKGAQNAGIDALWYNPKHKSGGTDLPILGELSNLGQIREFLGSAPR